MEGNAYNMQTKEKVNVNKNLKAISKTVKEIATELKKKNSFDTTKKAQFVYALELTFNDADDIVWYLVSDNQIDYTWTMMWAKDSFEEDSDLDDIDTSVCAGILLIKIATMHHLFKREFDEFVLGEKDKTIEMLEDIEQFCTYISNMYAQEKAGETTFLC